MTAVTVTVSRMYDLYDSLGVDTARSAPWDAAQMTERLNSHGIARYRDPGQAIADPELEALYDELAAAHANREEITVTEEEAPTEFPLVEPEPEPEGAVAKTVEEPVTEMIVEDPPADPAPKAKRRGRVAKSKEKPAKAKPAKAAKEKTAKGKPAKAARTVNVTKEWREKVRAWKRNPARMNTNVKGVFATIRRELEAAGKGKKPHPVTKAELLGILKREFPKRDPEKMKTTINNLVPSRLTYKFGLDVQSEKTDSGH